MVHSIQVLLHLYLSRGKGLNWQFRVSAHNLAHNPVHKKPSVDLGQGQRQTFQDIALSRLLAWTPTQ